ncbi:hypothetical protein PHLCEN_2v4312 [Hermanssonia centrifuga]|uniref:F-box domain-containing protein n=1 Tax=Hermanssonia centrifuga TaxID=98765 RepID=A0A2R6PVD6_9APHY|nr:hypothetical protein PHLCEN_2v4312 [Hermanssonia centrifuga]
MVLNFDVLAEVMSFIKGSDLLSPMQTCRSLYHAGVPHLLAHNINLRTRAKLLSFCRFILTDPSRFQFLRHLDISVHGRFKTDRKAFLLLVLFTYAHQLQRLRIFDCEILDSHCQIPFAIAALTSLKSLTLHLPNDSAYQMLKCMRSNIVKISICFYRDDVAPQNPVPLLSYLCHSLQELRVTYVHFEGAVEQCYPSLRTLVVDDCQFANVEPLAKSFPNVFDLSVWMGQEDDDLEVNEIEECRSINQTAQDTIGWDGLDQLRGDILSLYMLGLRCQVYHLDVQSTFLTSSRSSQLRAILSDSRPSTFSVRIKAKRFEMSFLPPILEPVRETLTHLIVYMDLSDSAGEPDGMLATSLQSFDISFLALNVCWYSTGQLPQHPTEVYLEHMEFEKMARAAKRCVSSLRYFFIDSGRRPMSFWDVSHPEREARPLPAEEGWLMLAEEGVLTGHDLAGCD